MAVETFRGAKELATKPVSKAREIADIPLSRAREFAHNVGTRTNPEGYALSTAISGFSRVVLTIPQAGLAVAAKELGQELNPDLARALTIAGIAAINAVSLHRETETLDKKDYCASWGSSTAKILTGHGGVSAVVGHAFTYGQSSILNLAGAVAVAIGDRGLLEASLVANAMALPAWRWGWNSLILKDKADPVVNKMREGRKWAVNQAKEKVLFRAK